jgi:signal transduction histidine kinase
MKNDRFCPHCHQSIDPQATGFCGQCGVDISLAALVVEPVSLDLLPNPPGSYLAPEALVPRLGEYLIEKNLLDPEQLRLALEYQTQKASNGKNILIGQALVELELIERKSLDAVVAQQILILQESLKEANQKLERRVEERTADLQRALVQLTELNQLKSNFISNISHELRTPLTHIKGYLEILADRSLGALTPSQADAIEVLRRAENRLETLIEDLIQLSLAARGEIRYQIKPDPLILSVEQALTQASEKAKSKEIRMQTHIAEDLPLVLIDAQKIAWVMNQLLDNAIKFTPRGGHVVLSAAPDKDLVSIHVQDDGIGIPTDRLSEIFEPFHQLDSSVARRFPGTGLGLAMVRRILDAHGSMINVESSIGKGSHFAFSLPIANGNNG